MPNPLLERAVEKAFKNPYTDELQDMTPIGQEEFRQALQDYARECIIQVMAAAAEAGITPAGELTNPKNWKKALKAIDSPEPDRT